MANIAPRPPPEYVLEVFADPANIKDVVRAILHTIFFHRYFPTLRPSTIEVLDRLTLPYVSDPELETLIETRVGQMARQLSPTTSSTSTTSTTSSSPFTPSSYGSSAAQTSPYAPSSTSSPSSGRNTSLGGIGGNGAGGNSAGSGGGSSSSSSSTRGQLGVHFFEKRRRKGGGGGGGPLGWFSGAAKPLDEEVCWEKWRLEVTLASPANELERSKVSKAMETTLVQSILKIVTIVNRHKDHIPPITTSEANPFPYQIVLNPRFEGWGKTIGMR
ncbi:hypothetical protein MMC25_001187 [Agyrium rufum]|nr:hypothetical protein [Agyrium rufum]